MSVTASLRKAIAAAEKAGTSRYQIAKESKLAYSVLIRFLDSGSDLKGGSIDRLADYLGLELVTKGRQRGRRV